MTLAELKQYGLNIATNNLLIAHTSSDKHFASYTPEEVLTDIKSIKGIALMLELPEFSMNDQLSDNIRLITNSAFLILKKAKQGDYADIQSVYDSTATIAFQVLTKIYNDRKKANDTGVTSPESKLKHLEVNTLNLVDVGPVFDGWFGWRINLQFNSPINLTLNEDEWTDETAWQF